MNRPTNEKLTRRQMLRMIGFGSAGVALAACGAAVPSAATPAPSAAAPTGADTSRHAYVSPARPSSGSGGQPRKFGQLVAGKACGWLALLAIQFAAVELAEKLRYGIEAQPARQLRRRLDPAIAAHQQRQGRRFVDHARQTAGIALVGLNPAFLGANRQDHRNRRQRPGCKQQPDKHQCGL